ncbi:sodium-dependent transporter [Candidatus Merdisoma sp. HCP28S3_D10]|uniref:sodium-dependent transporter n=1 Tax=unclassified Candidatus Merdisoma TaxID=3099611 RepID=UPI003F89B33E
MKKKEKGFSGSLGFVLAAAGSAVGVGNIWRFPYLCAKDGGGLFLLIYLILVLTFGFTLLTTDVAIGRRTKQNAMHAYATLNQKWSFLGLLTFLVPTLIMTYYSVIGGWILKYLSAYVVSDGTEAAAEGYFTGFITSQYAPVVFTLIFLAFTAWVVYRGVEKGIEKFSRVIMPGLLILIVIIAVFSLTLTHTDADGTVRTGMQGLALYLKPDFHGLTVKRFLEILLDAMSQLFFSLSVSMGIMITYGSYVKDDVNLSKSMNHIEFFDTGVAFLAGMMIIPAVFVFLGTDGMTSGPSLTFISLPKVFEAMGGIGRFVGTLFFLMLAFAALTSCVSVMETLVANCMELFHQSRKKMCAIVGVYSLVTAVLICLGYNIFYFDLPLPNGSNAQLLDLMDYISNSFLMPFISLLSSILIGWIVGPEWITDEVTKNGEAFPRAGLYRFMIRYVVPVIMLILFLMSTGVWDFIF